MYTVSARFYAESFERDAKLADDLGQPHRYNAACAAALAGCGKGEDAANLDDTERSRLRQQGLVWLRADFTLWSKHAQSDDPKDRAAVQKALKQWQSDSDLAGIRDKDALDKLPEAERDACRKFWADVEALRTKGMDGPRDS